MRISRKIVVGVCAVALTSMTALPAFAETMQMAPEHKEFTASGSTQTPMIIDAALYPTSDVVSVKVPTQIGVAFIIDKSAKTFSGETSHFLASKDVAVTNVASARAVKVSLSTKSDTDGFLNVAKLTMNGIALASASTGTEIVASVPANNTPVLLPIKTTAGTDADFTKFVDSTTAIGNLQVQTEFKVELVTTL